MTVTVPVPPECRPDVALSADDEERLPERAAPRHMRLYTQALRGDLERSALMSNLAKACARTMARAIEHCFASCLADASEVSESDAEADDDCLRMPERIYAGQRSISCSVVHRFLNVAVAHNALLTARDGDAPDDDDGDDDDDDARRQTAPPILCYNADTRRLSIPCPRAVVERHWEAAKHLLDLAVRVELWIRDRRRRIEQTPGVMLPRCAEWVTLSTDGPVTHGDDRRAVVMEELDDATPRLAEQFWPTWPPREHDLCTDARVRTALRWGRHATCSALDATASKSYLPHEPYHQLRPEQALAIASSGEHAWLHRAHAVSSAAEAPPQI